jgi:SAM-dependent methyltransferase
MPRPSAGRYALCQHRSMRRAKIADYYRTVAPFFRMEMALRDDTGEWVALAQRLGARRILDLGAGQGRVGQALLADDPGRRVVCIDLTDALLQGRPAAPFVLGDMRSLPFGAAAFDLIAAANDPFAHLLTDEERSAAVGESLRTLAPGGRLVIDGLWLPPRDREAARDRLVRERSLGGVALRETWHEIGSDTYDTVYDYRSGTRRVASARTDVRAWRLDEPALRSAGGRIAGGFRDEPFDAAAARLVLTFERAP